MAQNTLYYGEDKQLREQEQTLFGRIPKGTHFKPENFPQLHDPEWNKIGQFMELPESARNLLSDNAHLIGNMETVHRIAFLYCFQTWDLGRFEKPDETPKTRGMALIYLLATKRLFSLSLMEEWLDYLDLPKFKDVITEIRKMDDFRKTHYKRDHNYSLLIRFVMDDDHKTILGTPLKRSLKSRVFLLDFFKPGSFSNEEFLEMKKEYEPLLSEVEKIAMTGIMDIIFHFDHLGEFTFNQLLEAVKPTKRGDKIPQIEFFMKENEKELKDLGLLKAS
ncbi:hypothetical protein LOD99_11562 [Oopsacas minuta]|uniref:Uncharacterized protein n=1 Tax=Oopsacas minuta TaxID=111878 RepID=A0AAV7JKG7_9METZ|nr:hypothetical protein LOD99_11562 [Oopsacas minuta]